MDEICLKAAELIENNWVKFAFYYNEQMCMDGALYLAANGHAWCNATPEYEQAAKRVARVLPKFTPCEWCWGTDVLPWDDEYDSGNMMQHYNDHHCDGGVQAAKILREAAEVQL